MGAYEANQILTLRPPREGSVIVRASSAANQVEDLTAWANKGLCVEIHAETTDLWITMGVANTVVASASATGTGNTVAARVPSGQSKRFKLQRGKDNFLAFISSGAGLIRMEANSDADPGAFIPGGP